MSSLPASFVCIRRDRGCVVALPRLRPRGIGKATSPSNAYVLAIANGRHGEYGAMLPQLRAAARQGDVRSQELLAVALLGSPAGFRYGGPTGQQTCEAVRWLDAAAIQGGRIGQA